MHPTRRRLLFVAAIAIVAAAWRGAAREPRVMFVDLDPVDPPARATHHAIAQPGARLIEVPMSGWLRGFSVVLTDVDGRPVRASVLHHVKILVPARRELFLEKMQRVGSAGAETEAVLLPRMLGYPVRRGDTLLVNAMLDNVDGEAIRGVRLRVELRYTPADAWPPPVAIQPFYMSVVPPGLSTSYDLPPGRSVRSWEGHPAVSGRLLAVGGHVHRYARTLGLEDATTGETLWKTAPDTNAAGDVERVPGARFVWRVGLPIRRDHVYRISAVYDNPTGDTIRAGAMGVLGGVFLPDRAERWPQPNGRSLVYKADLAKQLAGGPDEPSGAEMARAHGAHRPGTHEQPR